MNDESNTSVGQETANTEQVTEQDEPAVDQQFDGTQEMSLEDLLAMTDEDFAEFEPEANHKGMKPLHHWLNHVPEDVRKHLGNIRSSYTRKTQELAEQRRQLEEQSKSLQARLMETQEATLNNPMLEKMRGIAADETDIDLYTEEGLQAAIQREAAKMVKEMLEPAQLQMKQELEIKRREMALQDFKQQHPDLTSPEMKMPIAQLLMERPELKLEDAYYIVKSKMETQKAVEAQAVAQQQRSTRKEALNKTSTGKAATPAGTPKFRDAWKAYNYHKSRAANK